MRERAKRSDVREREREKKERKERYKWRNRRRWGKEDEQMIEKPSDEGNVDRKCEKEKKAK